MRASGTSFSLSLEGGSSAVCGSGMLRIMLWHYWNYFWRHSYREQSTWQHLFPGAICPSRAAEELVPPLPFSAQGRAPRRCTALPELQPGTTVDLGPRAGVISVADEANEVANDVAGDVANDDRRTRQHRAGCKALERVTRGCRHLNTARTSRGWNTTMITTAQV